MPSSNSHQLVFENPTAQTIYEEISTRMSEDNFSIAKIIDSLLVEPHNPSAHTQGVITEITVEGVRSFGPSQSIKVSNDITLIYAPNGSGKTSFIDALELLEDGETSRSKMIQTASEANDSRHIPHRLKDGSASSYSPTVAISWLNELNTLQVNTWKSSFGTGIEGLPKFELIARRQLRNLVNSKPAERLGILASALNLEYVEKEWGKVATALIAQRTTTDSLNPIHTAAAHLLSTESFSDHTPDAIKRWGESQITSNETVVPLPPVPPNLSDNFSEIFQRLENCREKIKERSEPLSSLLNEIYLKIIQLEDKNQKCPVCFDGELTQKRIAEIRSELLESSAVTNLNSKIEKYKKDLKDNLEKLSIPDLSIPNPGNWHKDINEEELRASVNRIQKKRQELESRKNRFSRELNSSRHLEFLQCFQEYNNELETLRPRVLNYIEIIKKTNKLDPQTSVIAKICQSNPTAISQEIESINKEKKITDLLKLASSEIKNKSVEKTTEKILQFATEINEWLRILAPDNTPSIRIKSASNSGSKPSLKILIESENATKEIHAVGHLSDAQLDMFCLAAHLARIDKECPEAIIVLDDPSDMLDNITTKKFAQKGLAKILASPNKHQIIILTHDNSLVKEIWDYSSQDNIDLVQNNFELILSPDETDIYSFISPRNIGGALSRISALENSADESDKYRIWYRSAYAAHIRIALEMFAKDVAEILGPKCLDILPSSIAPNSTIDSVSQPIRNAINNLRTNGCQHPRHTLAFQYCDTIRDLLSGAASGYLNPGSHADVILPEIAMSKDYKNKLKRASRFLEPESPTPEERLTSTSLAHEMKILISCEEEH